MICGEFSDWLASLLLDSELWLLESRLSSLLELESLVGEDDSVGVRGGDISCFCCGCDDALLVVAAEEPC